MYTFNQVQKEGTAEAGELLFSKLQERERSKERLTRASSG